MESIKDGVSEMGESEDLPSDFFDDFNKDEFMEGLSVIDECWDDASGTPTQKRDSRARFVDAVDSVKDLRELIGETNDDEIINRKAKRRSNLAVINSKYRWRRPDLPLTSKPDDSITKQGSRRDPSKTNEAIKKDKEVKVQQFLAKSLESSDDLRPPGTELDDYYEEEKRKKEPIYKERDLQYDELANTSKEHLQSPLRLRHSPRPRHSPRMRRSPHIRHSPRPRFSPRGSPRRMIRNPSPSSFRQRYPARRFSPYKNFRRNYSPQRRSPPRRSPPRHSPPRRSPRRYSPARRSPRRQHRSRSPRRHHGSRHSRSRSHSRPRSPRHDDSFLYPTNSDAATGYPLGNPIYQPELGQQYAPPVQPEFPANISGYPYPQVPAYGGGFPDPYNYGVPQVPQATMPASELMPNMNPVSTPTMLNPVSAPPPMVPAPQQSTVSATDKATPYDALAQLVAEGKISQEDYLKLTPNKGQTTTMDTKTRVLVLTRCNQALSRLDKLLLPNRLMLNNQILVSAEDKYLAPKYCSPLKRQAVTEFSFTKGSVSPAQQTKQLVESIVSTLGLDKVVSKYKRKVPKDMKDAVNQTTRPACEVCEIRESTKYHDVGTSTEPEYFTSTIHTQVVEQDLISSKSIFNPSGSVGEGAAISIAHLTPAQLVSQLAARAKTLKQPQEPLPQQNQFNRRPPPNYDYDGRGGQQYHHSYNNYRY